MSTAEVTSMRRRIWVFGIVNSVVILSIGLWVSLATGAWIALLCASGLVAFPAGGIAIRSRRSAR